MYASGVKKPTVLVSSSNAVKFSFCAEGEEAEATVGDNAVLTFNENGMAGCEEFAK